MKISEITGLTATMELNYSELGGILAPICRWCAENGVWKEAEDADAE